MKTNIAKTLIESFGLVQEAADPAKVQRFIQLVNSGQMSGELIDLQRQLRPEMLSSDALAQAFSKMNGMMVDKIATNKNPQAAPKPGQPKVARPGAAQQAPKAGSDPKVLQLQKSLIAKGAKIAADGIMGPQTQTAMKQFGQKPATPTSQPAQPVSAKTGGAAQAKPASQAFDDMPPIVPQATQPVPAKTGVGVPAKPAVQSKPATNHKLDYSSNATDIENAVSQLQPTERADLANKLKDMTRKQSWLPTGLSQEPSDGRIDAEFQKLIQDNPKQVVSYLNRAKG